MENIQSKTPLSQLNCFLSLNILNLEWHKRTELENKFIDLVSKTSIKNDMQFMISFLNTLLKKSESLEQRVLFLHLRGRQSIPQTDPP